MTSSNYPITTTTNEDEKQENYKETIQLIYIILIICVTMLSVSILIITIKIRQLHNSWISRIMIYIEKINSSDDEVETKLLL